MAKKLIPLKVAVPLSAFFFTMSWLCANEAFAAQGGATTFNDARIAGALEAVMAYLEGTFGALVMAAAGIGTILAASIGQYKAAISLMVVAIGAFTLRSFMSTFFNDETDGLPTSAATAFMSGGGNAFDVAMQGNTLIIRVGSAMDVVAWRGGSVGKIGPFGQKRLKVSVDHGGGFESHYRGLAHLQVANGTRVESGQTLGRTAPSGKTEIQFHVTKDGQPVPLNKLWPDGMSEKAGMNALARSVVVPSIPGGEVHDGGDTLSGF